MSVYAFVELVGTSDQSWERAACAAIESAARSLRDMRVARVDRLDTFVGHRMSVSGILMGAGGADGINVTTINRVAESCP